MTHTLRIIILSMWAPLLWPLAAQSESAFADHVDRFRIELGALVEEAHSTRARPDRDRIEALYLTYFANRQFGEESDSDSLSELAALHTATEAALFYTLSPMLLDRLGPLVTQLAERLRQDNAGPSNIERRYLEGFHADLLRVRRFSQAQEFSAKHGLAASPWNLIDKTTTDAGPTILEIDPDHNSVTLTRTRVDLASGPKVVAVVHPACRFSEHAMVQIEKDPRLTSFFAKRTVWLGDAGRTVPLQPIIDWNAQSREIKIAISYDNHAWPPEIDFSTPAFYFFREGVLRDIVVGWPGPEQVERLHAGFRAIGIDSAIDPMPH
jgi:hypothetical protein